MTVHTLHPRPRISPEALTAALRAREAAPDCADNVQQTAETPKDTKQEQPR